MLQTVHMIYLLPVIYWIYCDIYDITVFVCCTLYLGQIRRIIVNPHKKSRDFLYYFNTLRFSERYCILFLYRYNGDKKREIKKSRTEKRNQGEVIRQKKKRAARRIRRTDQWEHLRKGLFRYRDTARQADLQATRRWRITGHQIIISRCDRGAAWKTN